MWPAQRRRDWAGCWPAAMWDWGLGFFLQLCIIDVDSRRGFAAFPQALPCGVHCRWPHHCQQCGTGCCPLTWTAACLHCPWDLPPGSHELTDPSRGRCWGTGHGQSSALPSLDAVTPWDRVTLWLCGAEMVLRFGAESQTHPREVWKSWHCAVVVTSCC